MSRKLSKEKVQNILNGGAEPVFTAEDMATDESKSRALDRGMYWYRQSFSPNTAKEWIGDWFTAKGRDDEAQIVGRAGKQHGCTVLSHGKQRLSVLHRTTGYH